MHIMWCFIQPTPLILIWLGTSQKAGRVEIDFIVPAQITIACLKVGWFNRVKQLLFGLVAQYCVSVEVNNFTVVETQYWATSNTICFKTSAIHTISPCPIKEPSTFKFDFFEHWQTEIEDELEENEEMDIQARGKGSARQNIIRFNGGQPIYSPSVSNRPITTLYEFTATVSTAISIPLVTTCIPLSSFIEAKENTGKSATLPCASGRKRRVVGTRSGIEESISPSKIER